jgi:hypothetical protein
MTRPHLRSTMPSMTCLVMLKAVEVGADDRIPVGLGHLLEGHVAGDAGVVDQHIDRTDFLVTCSTQALQESKSATSQG